MNANQLMERLGRNSRKLELHPNKPSITKKYTMKLRKKRKTRRERRNQRKLKKRKNLRNQRKMRKKQYWEVIVIVIRVSVERKIDKEIKRE